MYDIYVVRASAVKSERQYTLGSETRYDFLQGYREIAWSGPCSGAPGESLHFAHAPPNPNRKSAVVCRQKFALLSESRPLASPKNTALRIVLLWRHRRKTYSYTFHVHRTRARLSKVLSYVFGGTRRPVYTRRHDECSYVFYIRVSYVLIRILRVLFPRGASAVGDISTRGGDDNDVQQNDVRYHGVTMIYHVNNNNNLCGVCRSRAVVARRPVGVAHTVASQRAAAVR